MITTNENITLEFRNAKHSCIFFLTTASNEYKMRIKKQNEKNAGNENCMEEENQWNNEKNRFYIWFCLFIHPVSKQLETMRTSKTILPALHTANITWCCLLQCTFFLPFTPLQCRFHFLTGREIAFENLRWQIAKSK